MPRNFSPERQFTLSPEGEFVSYGLNPYDTTQGTGPERPRPIRAVVFDHDRVRVPIEDYFAVAELLPPCTLYQPRVSGDVLHMSPNWWKHNGRRAGEILSAYKKSGLAAARKVRITHLEEDIKTRLKNG